MVPVELTSELRAALELDEDQFGIFVDSVEDGTPAAEGGLEPGDVITKWNDEDVQKVNDFRIKVARVRPGEKATAEVIRGGKTRSLKFTLVDRAQHMAGITGTTPQLPRDEIEAPYLGLEVAELDARTFARYELDEELVRRHGGVVITGLRRDSPARGDLSPGDVITKIDRYTIEDLDDYRGRCPQVARTRTRDVGSHHSWQPEHNRSGRALNPKREIRLQCVPIKP